MRGLQVPRSSGLRTSVSCPNRSNPRENPQVSAEVGYTPGMPSRPERGGAHLRFCPVPCEDMLSNLLGTSGYALAPPILDPRGHFETSCARLNSFLQLSRGTIRDGANDNRSDGWDMQPSSSTSGAFANSQHWRRCFHLLLRNDSFRQPIPLELVSLHTWYELESSAAMSEVLSASAEDEDLDPTPRTR